MMECIVIIQWPATAAPTLLFWVSEIMLTRDMTPMPATPAETDARIRTLLMKGLGHVAIDGEAIGAGAGGIESV
jgi:hypothetical protein